MELLAEAICSAFPEICERITAAENRINGNGLLEFACANVESIHDDATKPRGLSYLKFIINRLDTVESEDELERLDNEYLKPLIETGRNFVVG